MVQTGWSYRNRGVGHSVQVGFIEIGETAQRTGWFINRGWWCYSGSYRSVL